MNYRVRVLGADGCRIVDIERPAKAVTDTLALLVAAGPAGVDGQRLAEQVWPDGLADQWKSNINRRVSRIRQLGVNVENDSGRYCLDLNPDEVDGWHLETLVERAAAEGLAAQSASDWAALADLTAAKPILVGVGEADMIEVARSRLQALQEQAHQLLNRQGGGADDWVPPDQTVGDDSSMSRLQRHRAPSLVGRGSVLHAVDQALEAEEPGRATPVVVLDVDRGLGRTALLAEVAHRWGDRAQVVELLGAPTENLVVAPLRRLAPGLDMILRRPDAITGVGPGPDVGTGRAYEVGTGCEPADQSWDTDAVAAQVVSELRQQASDAELLVLIDDAHLFDGDAAAIVAASLVELAQPGSDGVAGRRGFRGVVLATRTGSLPPWLTCLQPKWGPPPLAAPSATWIEVEPLGADDLELMVEQAFPGLAPPNRQDRARWLLAASGGIPDVTHHLLTSAAQGQPPAGLARYDHALAMLTTPTRELAAQAAVLGRRFQSAELTALSDASETEVCRALHELVDERLARVSSLGEVEFSDDVIVDTWVQSLNRGRRARLHLRALDLLTGGTERPSGLLRALDEVRHRLGAGSWVDAVATAKSVLAVLHDLAAQERWWQSWLLIGSVAAHPDVVERLRGQHGAIGSDLLLRLQAAHDRAATRAGVLHARPGGASPFSL